MFLSFLLSTFVLCPLSWAFVPSSDYLLEKAVKNAGKGFFHIEQEVVFKSDTETLTVREQWTVQDAQNLRLSIRAPGLSAAFVYDGNKVYFSEAGGALSSRRISPENIERFIHARSERVLANLLLHAKIVSVDPLRARPKPKTLAQIKYDPDPYVRLVRLDKEPSFLISYSPNTSDAGSTPGIWLEQNSFAIKQIRFPSLAEAQAQQLVPLSQDLVLPRTRIVTWDQNLVEIRLIKANSVTRTKAVETSLTPNSITTPNQWPSTALANQVREFYQRFR